MAMMSPSTMTSGVVVIVAPAGTTGVSLAMLMNAIAGWLGAGAAGGAAKLMLAKLATPATARSVLLAGSSLSVAASLLFIALMTLLAAATLDCVSATPFA